MVKMLKIEHEIRDPIHVFVRLYSDERKVLDSRPFQRLRHIHQLGLSHFVYPGATHKRFEHSLGVMELAGRVFDVVTHKDAITDEIKYLLPEVTDGQKCSYWRRVLRMAALCHDIGHLPFSHAGEGLLPSGWNHERLTVEIIRSDEMEDIWKEMTPPLRTEDIVKLAVGIEQKDKCGLAEFTPWETVLSEIIVGDAFGVDRMDYLLRDSHHAGVAYGRFDHYRLIDTLRILTPPPLDEGGSGKSEEPTLGVQKGGIHSAESLLLARYFMFSQVYCHHIRRIYDIHLKDFIKLWFKGEFSTNVDEHLKITDVEVTNALRKSYADKNDRCYKYAERVLGRKHFKVLYERKPGDIQENPDAVSGVYEATCKKFGDDNVRRSKYIEKDKKPDFPVEERDKSIVSAQAQSQVLKNVPVVAIDYVFISRDCYGKAEEWLKVNRKKIIELKGE